MVHLDQRRSPDAGFEVGGRRYGVFAHDWRVEPPLAWMDRKGEHELHRRAGGGAGGRDAGAAAGPLPAGVRGGGPAGAARRHPPGRAGRQPPAPLAARHRRHAGEPTPATLQALLREAADTLRANPKDEQLYRALLRTYLQPAATQELAAELLGLPFSTYRYHLAGGIPRDREAVAAELHGPEG